MSKSKSNKDWVQLVHNNPVTNSLILIRANWKTALSLLLNIPSMHFLWYKGATFWLLVWEPCINMGQPKIPQMVQSVERSDGITAFYPTPSSVHSTKIKILKSYIDSVQTFFASFSSSFYWINLICAETFWLWKNQFMWNKKLSLWLVLIASIFRDRKVLYGKGTVDWLPYLSDIERAVKYNKASFRHIQIWKEVVHISLLLGKYMDLLSLRHVQRYKRQKR